MIRLDQFHLECLGDCPCNSELENLLHSKNELDKIKLILDDVLNKNKSILDNIKDFKIILQKEKICEEPK